MKRSVEVVSGNEALDLVDSELHECAQPENVDLQCKSEKLKP